MTAPLKSENVGQSLRLSSDAGGVGDPLASICDAKGNPSDCHQVAADNLDDRQRVDDFAEVMGGWFWETDAQNRFTYFSPSVFDITGVPPEWHYGKTRRDIGHPKTVSADAWQRHLDTIERRLPFSDFVFQRTGPDGIKWMRTSGKPVFDADGTFKGYRGTATDATAEIEAQNRASRLSYAIENLEEFFVLWDPSDRLITCNAQFREINAKVAHTTVPGTHFDDHIRAALKAGLYPGARGREEDWFEKRKKQHRNPNGSFELERQDGRWILLSEQKLPDGSIATISTDITERKRIEEAIEEKNKILETVLRTIPDGISVFGTDCDMVIQNDQLFEVLDLEKNDILGATSPGAAYRHARATRGDYGSGNIAALVTVQEEIIQSSAPVQYERQLSNGKWIECRGNPIPGGGFLAVFRDTTEKPPDPRLLGYAGISR